jgi:ABC-2 type transport system permease protein
MGPLRLYFRYVGVSVRGQMQYRASFIMTTIGTFGGPATELLGIWVMFRRFSTLRGWRMEEVLLFYGIVGIAFSLAEGVGRGFDLFDGLIRQGGFDRLLLRPRGTAFQVAAQQWQPARIGRLAQGAIAFAWGASAVGVHWTLSRIALVPFAVLGGACLFYGLFVLQATTCFWTVESLEIWNTVTYGGNEAGEYPVSIYRPWFRRFFTFVIPLACVSYFPMLAILDRRDELGSPFWFQAVAPLFGIAFILLSLRIWQFGVRHYRSTGS